jgi:hypothetical protein
MMNIHSAARHMDVARPPVRSSGKLVSVSRTDGVDASGLLSAPHAITSADWCSRSGGAAWNGGIRPRPTPASGVPPRAGAGVAVPLPAAGAAPAAGPLPAVAGVAPFVAPVAGALVFAAGVLAAGLAAGFGLHPHPQGWIGAAAQLRGPRDMQLNGTLEFLSSS